jgi:alanyl-tRNA synthetase
MVQFKPYFTGESVPPSPRLASCQKCFRTTDIGSVGNFKHLTFFEMLGNFSIGDYFKKDAIAWAWEFVLDWLKIPRDKLWITIFLDDDESFRYWREIGVGAERIVRCGEKDNFWGPAGETGPCGPCSEIHYDFGEQFGCGPNCSPSCGCGRFLEIWNLVFTEYYQDADKKRTPLPKKNIDTGMGLERTATVIQGKRSFYDTDLFAPIMKRVSELTNRQYGDNEKTDRAMRIVAEHGRAVAFLITDGVIPSNEGRGYVLRRVLRRAVLFGRTLGLDKPFLGEIAKEVIARMGHVYPDLVKRRDTVLKVINTEETRFDETLSTGLNLLNQIMEQARGRADKKISGEEVFRLSDTYGFPSELTAEMAEDNGLSVDMEGFESEMERQRERARAAHKFGGDPARASDGVGSLLKSERQFVGYKKLVHKSEIVEIMTNNQPVDFASQEQEVEIVLQETPLYGEMGGQLGDTGEVRGLNGSILVSNSVQTSKYIVHHGKVVKGRISKHDVVTASVDRERRLDIARNHTATHLLHSALRQVLGSHVHQSGSLVAPERFRFDFTYEAPVLKEELLQIQRIVNEGIRRNLSVTKKEMPYAQAVAEGAIALFGEKYGDKVRTVKVGSAKSPLSFEVCGGTHVDRTGDIGYFLVVGEGSIGSGMRRIEAVTGRQAEKLIEERAFALERVAHQLQVPAADIESKITGVLEELDAERKRAVALERQLSKETAESLLAQAESVKGVSVLSVKTSVSNMDALRHMGDVLKEKLGSGVVVLAAVWDDKPNFLAMVTPDLVAKGLNAGEIIKRVAQATGGSGGGRPQMAQGGGRDKDKLEGALKLVASLVEEKL